jgi:two-component system response regulator PfeR
MQQAVSRTTRILAVEDDPVLAEHLCEHLGRYGFEVTLRHAGEEVARLVAEQPFDLVLLDILLPGLGGLEALGELRRSQYVPVILMSALGAEQDRIAGFSQGADDYLPKPFSMAELFVRIEAVLRRVGYERRQLEPPRRDLALVFDDALRDVCHAGHWAELTSTEYRLLDTFWRHPEDILSKPFLYQQVLHRPYSRHDRALDLHVSHLRRKLLAVGYRARRLATAWGKGYVLTGAAD